MGGAGAEAAAGGGGEEEGADVEAGENGGDDGGGKREVHRRRRRRGDGLDRIWRRHGARWWIGVGVGRWPESDDGGWRRERRERWRVLRSPSEDRTVAASRKLRLGSRWVLALPLLRGAMLVLLTGDILSTEYSTVYYSI